MKFEIKNRFSASLLFSLETETLKLCIEAAVKQRADLGGADLGGADLGGAYLRGAYLRGAYLGGAKLEHEGTELVLIGDRPFLQIGPIGSRLDYLSAFSTDHGIYVRTGCFWNTLDAFRAAVAEEHGDSVHAIEYVAAISMIELHAKHWAPVTAASAAA